MKCCASCKIGVTLWRFDDLVQVCADFFSPEVIEKARLTMGKYVKRIINRQGVDKCVKTVEDLLKFILDSSVSLQKFYSVNLKVPPVGIEHIDLSALLAEVSALRSEVRKFALVQSDISEIRKCDAQLKTEPGCRNHTCRADIIK